MGEFMTRAIDINGNISKVSISTQNRVLPGPVTTADKQLLSR
ncbi:hypothetical protein [Phormidesmis priestleyi]